MIVMLPHSVGKFLPCKTTCDFKACELLGHVIPRLPFDDDFFCLFSGGKPLRHFSPMSHVKWKLSHVI